MLFLIFVLLSLYAVGSSDDAESGVLEAVRSFIMMFVVGAITVAAYFVAAAVVITLIKALTR